MSFGGTWESYASVSLRKHLLILSISGPVDQQCVQVSLTMADYTSNSNYGTEAQRGHPPAQTVGAEFSRQFYMVLTQQPGLAHRFYTDGSSLTNAVAGASGVTVYGQTAINEKIMSLNLEHARVEVESVDAQYSLLSGVAVLITGHMTKVGKERRPFVQSFFLATQERGYYVLNDTFRYMEPLEHSMSKSFSAEFPQSIVTPPPNNVTHALPQQYGGHHEAHGYSSLGGSSSGQPQQMQAPQEPHPQASAFQQANGHLHAHHTNTDLGSGFSSGHSSGDLAQIPSPPPSQSLPPPPPRPDAASVAPTPTPAQQSPTAPSHEPSAEQEPEHSSSQEEQQQPSPQEKGASNDQPVPQPAVDQNRPPVKPQRRPSAPATQEAQRKGSGQQSPAPARSGLMSYADLLKPANIKHDAPASGPTQQSGRQHTPSLPPAAAAAAAPTAAATAQTASPAPAPALPPRASGNRNQGRHAPAAAAAAPAAGSDTSSKDNQRGAPPMDKPAGNNASANGPPARPPYSAPGRGPAQGYRDDESSKKAVFVRNVPQDATSQDIRALFAQFGTIKPQNGAITVKHNGNNNSFAYVDFVDVASAQACVEAKDVQLYGTTLDITPKRASFGGGRGGGRYSGRGDGRAAGGYGRGRGGDRGGFSGRGGPPVGSFAEETQMNGSDRPQGNRQNTGGPGPVRGRGGRDGVRGRGRGGARTPATSQAPDEAAPLPAE